jgi:hypothetical protein
MNTAPANTTQTLNKNKKIIRKNISKNQTNKRPQNVRQNAQRKPRQRKEYKKQDNKSVEGVKVIGLFGHPRGAQLIASNSFVLNTNVELAPLILAGMTYASRIYYANTIGVTMDSTQQETYGNFNSGLSYMLQSIYDIAGGQTIMINQIPRVFSVLTQLLTKKEVRLGRNVIQYTPQWSESFAMNGKQLLPNGNIFAFVVPTTGAEVALPVGVIPPSQEDYQIFLRNSELKSCWGTKTIDFPGDTVSLACYDPSCYARSYVYYGTSGTSVDGLYSESELEVPFCYPQFAKFVKYNLDDEVVSRVFYPQSGGVNTPIGLSITSSEFSHAHLRNPYPVNYKFLDLEQLYTALCGWLIALFNSTNSGVENGSMFTSPLPFNFSARDFFLMLRQAVLSQFNSQCHAQFVSPVHGTPSQSNSMFLPFIVDSVGFPPVNSGQMIIPTFFVENLSMLKHCMYDVTQTANSTKYSTQPKKLRHNWVPVWGSYSGSDLVIPTFGLENIPIFNTTNVIPECRFSDLISSGNSNNKVQINNYVPALIMEWNQRIEAFAQNKSSSISAIQCDVNKNVSLLAYTRVLSTKGSDGDEITMTTAGLPPRRPNFPMDKYISNARPKKIVRTQSFKSNNNTKSQVEVVPPANYADLYEQSITAHSPLSTQFYSNLRFFILPVIRLDNTGPDDKLTLSGYTVYQGELSVASATSNQTFSYNGSEMERLMMTGQLCATGLYASDNKSNTLVQAIDIAVTTGQGSDFIRSILGGIASIIPVVGPALGQAIAG